MGPAQIHVHLEGGRFEAGAMHFLPGAPISGTVEVRPHGNLSCKHLYVRLQWHTEGRGTRDEGRVGELDVFQGTLSAGLTTSYPFRFVLPREPWSCSGHYVSIVWEVFVEIDVPWATNARHSQPFVMAPDWRRSQALTRPDVFDVILLAGGKDLATVMRILTVIGSTGTADAANLGFTTPRVLLQSVSRTAADEARKQLEKVGATVEVRPSGPGRASP